MSLPVVLLIPGFWEGPTVFDSVVKSLKTHGYTARAIPLQSTGQASPDNPSMTDDVRALHAAIESVVAEGQEVLLVLHSAGAFLGSMAIEGLSVRERNGQGLKGGVVKIVFLAGAVWPEGYQHGPLPFFDHQGDRMYCKSPTSSLFNDLDPTTASEWAAKLSCQPASGWDDVVTHTGWKTTPSVYLVCEQDALLPPPLQRQMAEQAGSVVEVCDAGHCVMIGQPERVVEVVRKAAGEGA